MSRTARAVTDSPISASSAPAWTMVRITLGRGAGCGCAARPGAGRVRSERPAAGARDEGSLFALGFVGRDDSVGRLAEEARLDGAADLAGAADLDEADLVGAAEGAVESPASADTAPRLLLRRCGRVRGSAPRISEGWSGFLLSRRSGTGLT